jgi:hypothetical protein
MDSDHGYLGQEGKKELKPGVMSRLTPKSIL